MTQTEHEYGEIDLEPVYDPETGEAIELEELTRGEQYVLDGNILEYFRWMRGALGAQTLREMTVLERHSHETVTIELGDENDYDPNWVPEHLRDILDKEDFEAYCNYVNSKDPAEKTWWRDFLVTSNKKLREEQKAGREKKKIPYEEYKAQYQSILMREHLEWMRMTHGGECWPTPTEQYIALPELMHK